jgi:hypothetical protein
MYSTVLYVLYSVPQILPIFYLNLIEIGNYAIEVIMLKIGKACYLSLIYFSIIVECERFENVSRVLQDQSFCDSQIKNKAEYSKYFQAMQNIYTNEQGTCLPVHRECGWMKTNSRLPLFVLSVGLEGAGHHLWTEILDRPVFDCVWVCIYFS